MLNQLHGGFVHQRRVRVLAAHFASLLPSSATILDVGCGDGRLGCEIQRLRPDLKLKGLDVLVRPEVQIPVERFDGLHIPCGNQDYDVVMFADVLHHVEDPMTLLREAARAARVGIAIKDHLLQGLFGRATLSFMDWVGNARHGVVLPYNYWTPQQWDAAFAQLQLIPRTWKTRLGLYPIPARLLFERSLHFVTLLEHSRPEAQAQSTRA